MHIQEEAARCLLCADAPCSKACKNGDPARAIRAIRFGNEAIAGQWIENCNEAELQAAEEACIHYDSPIRIKPSPLMPTCANPILMESFAWAVTSADWFVQLVPSERRNVSQRNNKN